MRYCARLEGVPNLDRPIEIRGQELTVMGKWAKDILQQYSAQHPEAHVDFYETKEVFLWSVPPKEAK